MSNSEKFDNEFQDKRQLRKKPYTEITIAELSKPGKYRIIGTIIEMREDSFIIQDDSGQLEVFIETMIDGLEEEDQVRILGRAEFEPERKFNAKIVQNLKNVNLEQYTQVREMEKSLRKNTK